MDFVGKRRWFLLFSMGVILFGIVSMLVPPGFRIGTEFTSGSALTITFVAPVAQDRVRDAMAEMGHPQAVIQQVGERGFLVRTRTLEEANSDAGAEATSERQRIEERLAGLLPTPEDGSQTIETSELFAVSPIVARETVRNAAIAVGFAAIAILFYITWAFRLVPKPFRMGAAAIMAAVHDVLIVLGLFSILGKFINVEINAMFITGILTVVGYSVHDTIVVFDRIRENTGRRVSRELETTVNISIMETLGRSLTTSITTVTVVVALLLLGGPTIQSLLFTLLIGILTGTYSSIFIASQILVVWEKREWRGLFRRGPAAPATPSPR